MSIPLFAIFQVISPRRISPIDLGQAFGQAYSPARMRTHFALLAGIYAVLLASPAGDLAKAGDRPDILFFLSDDHRWDRMGCAGHPFLRRRPWIAWPPRGCGSATCLSLRRSTKRSKTANAPRLKPGAKPLNKKSSRSKSGKRQDG